MENLTNRADSVILTVNDNPKYTQWIPLAYKSWKLIGITPYIFYCGKKELDAKYEKYIYSKIDIPSNWSSSSFSQVSRLLLPSTLKNIVKNCMISDIDYYVVPSKYWNRSGGHCKKTFVVMRNKHNTLPMMGFNSAPPEIWGKVFGQCNNISDVIKTLLEWRKVKIWREGWDDDQAILHSKIRKYPYKVKYNDNIFCLTIINNNNCHKYNLSNGKIIKLNFDPSKDSNKIVKYIKDPENKIVWIASGLTATGAINCTREFLNIFDKIHSTEV